MLYAIPPPEQTVEGCRCAAKVLEEFYENLQSVGVSAITGEGMTEFFDKVCPRHPVCSVLS